MTLYGKYAYNEGTLAYMHFVRGPAAEHLSVYSQEYPQLKEFFDKPYPVQFTQILTLAFAVSAITFAIMLLICRSCSQKKALQVQPQLNIDKVTNKMD